MARPLRKIKLDGTLYQRRPAVEAEIHDLTAVSPSELERRASICSRTSPALSHRKCWCTLSGTWEPECIAKG